MSFGLMLTDDNSAGWPCVDVLAEPPSDPASLRLLPLLLPVDTANIPLELCGDTYIPTFESDAVTGQ